MLPDRVSNPGPLTYESGALPIALRGPAHIERIIENKIKYGLLVTNCVSINRDMSGRKSKCSEACMMVMTQNSWFSAIRKQVSQTLFNLTIDVLISNIVELQWLEVLWRVYPACLEHILWSQ